MHFQYILLIQIFSETYQKLDACIIYTFGSVTGGSWMISKGKYLPVRFLISWWCVFILLLCNSYNSKIIACLTLPSYTAKINSGQQLFEQNFHWGRPYQDNISKQLDFEVCKFNRGSLRFYCVLIMSFL